ncbi:hypothetical protein B0I35DRAFT_426267 [Stachybotrys elegans]|uniref:Secreted protein n=1 Tax=Stachybotrys elegans TaxID=80388 RepID=A0A8K0WU17_9HYPO|nr:hypothetical protein B0I35DRAFT_426267 [Stachybotrys elegans]
MRRGIISFLAATCALGCLSPPLSLICGVHIAGTIPLSLRPLSYLSLTASVINGHLSQARPRDPTPHTLQRITPPCSSLHPASEKGDKRKLASRPLIGPRPEAVGDHQGP